MSEPRFPILGTDVPPMIGREKVMQRLWNDLTKASPGHLSIVGSRYSGKSVLLTALAERMKRGDSPYGAVIQWDLGHQTPDSDGAFLKSLCQRLGEGIKAINADYGDHLLSVESNEYSELREVIDALGDERAKVLMLWDGFDRPLSSGRLTLNLWDNLRELASNPSLRLVTATRRPLHELLRSDEIFTSPFFNIFTGKIILSPFDDSENQAILDSFSHIQFKPGGKTELMNWTGGYPLLYFGLLNHIAEIQPPGAIDNNHINDAASKALKQLADLLDVLWNDCSATAKDLYRHLLEHGDIPASTVGTSERWQLAEKGFLKSSGNKIMKACRLLEYHVKSLGDDVGSLVRLFRPPEEYRHNIRGLLELRLNQLDTLDSMLRRYIERSIEDIPEHPEVCLASIRGIVDRALDLVWEIELGADKQIPAAWFSDWRQKGETGAENYWNEQFPTKRGHQIRLLQLLTGTDKSLAKAKHVSKNTYALANALHGFGDFGQHLDGAVVPVGVAVAAVTTCLELAACLAQEL